MKRFIKLALPTVATTMLVTCLGISSAVSAATAESLTITTYYPSPYGVYRELRAKRMALGDNYYKSDYCWEGSCAANKKMASTTDLAVEENVVIGTVDETTLPASAKLNILTSDSPYLLYFSVRDAARSMINMATVDNDAMRKRTGLSIYRTDNDANSIAFMQLNNKCQGGYPCPANGYAFSFLAMDGLLHITSVSPTVNKNLIVAHPDGRVAINSAAVHATYELYVNGTAGNASGTFTVSDARWKENIVTLHGALDKILRLRGVEYNWKTTDLKDMKLPKGKQLGMIAQELEQEYPQLVMTDTDGYKAIDYSKLAPVLLEGIKEQQAQLKQQQAQIEELKSKMAAMEKKQAQKK